MGLHIENPEVEQLANELAKQTGTSPAAAVEFALTTALERLQRDPELADFAERKRRIREIVKSFGPVPPGLTSDHSDFYDEDGLPK
ncbi:MAG TPA: type II toxin-antitoxin system VapB family antitoxin [Mesorhizobium sp.]|nr:type II toxin-antitoxin system VapB family antitoxin [Mesorhizobium sp.]